MVDSNNCGNASISLYSGGSYYFVYVQTASESNLYYQDGTFYCTDAPGYSCRSLYSLTNAEVVWNCGGNTFKKNQDASNANFRIVEAFKIYPNPTTDKVFIDLPDEAIYQINLIDISGKIMKQMETEPYTTNVEINISDLTKGMYLVEMSNETSNTIQKLIIE